MTESPTTHRRHRSRKKQKRLLGTVRVPPELLWLAIGATGVLLLTVYPQLRQTMEHAAEHTVDSVTPAARELHSEMLDALAATTPVELFGLALVLIGAVAILYRLRWRLIHSPALTEVICPRCGGEVHRVHRHSLDRLINGFVPVRRYRCWNKECSWEGLRVCDPSSPRPVASHPET
jgi:hypothetical protein